MLIFGHRGARGEAPENTIAGFAAAVRAGVDGVELDVRLSADEQLVVIHDATVDRTTSGQGVVRELHSDILAELLPRKAAEAPNARGVPRLSEVMARFGQIPAFQIEVKTLPPGDYSAMITGLRTQFDQDDWVQRAVITSFDLGFLAALATAAPRLRSGLISDDREVDHISLAQTVAAGSIILWHELWTPKLVARAADAKLATSAWTVNDRPSLLRLRDLQVDSAVTDYPSASRDWLRGAPAAL